MQMPLGAAQIVFLAITATVATFVPRTRIIMMILNTVASLIGMVLVWKLDENDAVGRLVGLSLGAVFAVNIPLSLSVISSNVAGFTKRSVTSALLFVSYCLGNIVGPQFFLQHEEPMYPVSTSNPWGLLQRRILISVDWFKGRHFRSCIRGPLPVLPSCVLYRRESSSRRIIWTT